MLVENRAGGGGNIGADIDRGHVVEAVRSGTDPVVAHDRVRYDMMTKAGYKP